MIYKAAGRKEIENYKVVSGENVATQHQILVCWMSIDIKKRKRVNDEARINWWKLKKQGSAEFREELRWALGGRCWQMTAEVAKKTANKKSGVSSRQRKVLVCLMRRHRKVLNEKC